MKPVRLLTTGFILAMLVWTTSCQVQQDAPQTSTDDKGRNARLSTEAGALEVAYDAVTTTRTSVISYGKTGKNAAQEAIYGAPSMSHSSVSMKIMADGSVESETIVDEPAQNPWVRHNTPPDPSPRMGKAVMKGDQLYLYDVTGKLVDTRQMPTQNLKPMLDEMRAARNNVSADKALVAKATGLPGMDVDALLEMAKAKNARIEDLNSQLKKVEMDIDQPSQGGDGKGPSAFTVSYTLDMKRNLMLGGELVDRNTGQLLSKSVMQYTHRPDTNDDMIRMVYTEDYHQDAKTGRREKTITTCQYKRFTLTNNLN